MTDALRLAAMFGAGALGGAINSVAGGGSFVVFPTLLFGGIPPVAANATTAVALWPAGISSAIAYRKNLPDDRRMLGVLALASALGGGLGAVVLLVTSDATFAKLLPLLLLAASLVFTVGPRLSKKEEGAERKLPLVVGALCQLAISFYGGYFGGGMGILMLAVYTLMGMRDIHAMNAFKVVFGILINGVALVAFVVAGAVVYEAVFPVALGSIAGGFAGAVLARRVDPVHVRRFVLLVAWSLTAVFAYRAILK